MGAEYFPALRGNHTDQICSPPGSPCRINCYLKSPSEDLAKQNGSLSYKVAKSCTFFEITLNLSLCNRLQQEGVKEQKALAVNIYGN